MPENITGLPTIKVGQNTLLEELLPKIKVVPEVVIPKPWDMDSVAGFFGTDGKTLGTIGSGLSGAANIGIGIMGSMASYGAYKMQKKVAKEALANNREDRAIAKADKADFNAKKTAANAKFDA